MAVLIAFIDRDSHSMMSGNHRFCSSRLEVSLITKAMNNLKTLSEARLLAVASLGSIRTPLFY